jgi:hypothetical protein
LAVILAVSELSWVVAGHDLPLAKALFPLAERRGCGY